MYELDYYYPNSIPYNFQRLQHYCPPLIQPLTDPPPLHPPTNLIQKKKKLIPFDHLSYFVAIHYQFTNLV